MESPENQARLIRAYAENYGIEIVREYMDYGVSGLTAEGRDQFMEMIEDIKQGRKTPASMDSGCLCSCLKSQTGIPDG